MLEVQNLVKKYKKLTAVNNISFNIEDGEIGILLGPNGAGKSSTIKAISGLVSFEGTIMIGGFKNTTLEAKRIFSYVPEVPHMFKYLTVYEHCEFIAKAYKINNYKESLDRYLKIFEMEENKDKLGRELSKGMQQKLSIICALIINPKMIMFDEPLVGLDPKAIRECKKIFLRLKEEGIAILVSTHIIDTLSDIWDKVIILNHGNIVLEKNRIQFEEEYKDTTLEELFFNTTEVK